MFDNNLITTNLCIQTAHDFLETCTWSEECDSKKYLVCRQSKCLCQSNYYHKNSTCYYGNKIMFTSHYVLYLRTF